MVFAASCAIPGCHSANNAGAAGLDLRIGRRGQSPPRPRAVDQHRRRRGLRERRQAVPARGLEPGDGPAHGQDGQRQGDLWKHDVRARAAQLVPAHLPFGLGDRCHDRSHHAMTIRSATMLAARVALVVPLLVGATRGSALGAGGKRAGVPKFDGAQEIVVRKQVMKVLKAHGCELAKSREMELGVANTGALLESDDGFAKVAKELAAVGDRDRRRSAGSARRSPFTTAATARCWARRRSRARTRGRWRRRWRARSGASSAGKSNAAACRRGAKKAQKVVGGGPGRRRERARRG